MRTYPTLRRALAFLLAVVTILLGLMSMLLPEYLSTNFVVGVTDVMLGVSIVLGIVVIRSRYDDA